MNKLSTDPYKGVRDFYPEDMAVQQFIFDVWSQTAKSFGFQRYDASVLEPSELYKAKGAENEEMVNDQTYTFIDRGDREVTLRPEMTPTVARMVAAKSKELAFPVRWYSIPNLFRYERTQRGRVREHWQLNCDIFGSDAVAADVEIINLAYQTLRNFGASPEMFEIRLNDRREMAAFYNSLNIEDEKIITSITRLNDRFHKIELDEYKKQLEEIVTIEQAEAIFAKLNDSSNDSNEVLQGLAKLGIKNVKIDRSLARGFDYYTGIIFEIFDTSDENNRSMLGGGRYDNLTGLFSDEAIGGVGFGMGDVTMRDFLVTHDLLPKTNNAPQMVILPTEAAFNIDAEKVAQYFRAEGMSVLVDISEKKFAKKFSSHVSSGTGYLVVVGEDEVSRNEYVLKNLADGTESTAKIANPEDNSSIA